MVTWEPTFLGIPKKLNGRPGPGFGVRSIPTNPYEPKDVLCTQVYTPFLSQLFKLSEYWLNKFSRVGIFGILNASEIRELNYTLINQFDRMNFRSSYWFKPDFLLLYATNTAQKMYAVSSKMKPKSLNLTLINLHTIKKEHTLLKEQSRQMTTKFFLTRVQSTNYGQRPISEEEGTFTKEFYFKDNCAYL